MRGSKAIPTNLDEALQEINSSLYSQTYSPVVVKTLPVSSCEAERSFLRSGGHLVKMKHGKFFVNMHPRALQYSIVEGQILLNCSFLIIRYFFLKYILILLKGIEVLPETLIF